MIDYIIPWTIHPGRLSWRLSDLDITTALAYFKERTGQEATAIMLHPSVEKRLPAIPDGIMVEYSYRVLAHEVFLPVPADLPIANDPQQPPSPVVAKLKKVLPPTPQLCNTPENKEKAGTLPLYPVSKRGRPLKRGEVHRTTEWRRKRKMQGVLL